MRSKSPTPSLPEGGGGKSLTPNPSPIGEGSEMRDTPIVWGNLLVIPKRTVPCTPPLLSERGLGGEVFTRVKNLDIPSNKILETKVKNTYCELVCNSQKFK